MLYLFFPELKNLTLATTISGAIGTAIFSLAISQPVQAAQLNFSFAPDSELSDPSNVINEWDHGSGAGDGLTSGENTGTATDPTTRISITITGAASGSSSDPYLFGTAQSRSGNFTFDANNLTTKGLKFADVNSSDGNSITLTEGQTSDTLSGGTLNNYQLWTFEFSEPIIIDSDTKFFIDDIDDSRTNRNASNIYIDALAVEAFTTSTVGTLGTGIDPTFSFDNTNGNTELKTAAINFANNHDISYVYDSVNSPTNPANELPNRAYYDFGTTPVQSVALYFFNGVTTSDTGGHAVTVGGTFTVEEVPFEFSPSMGLLLSLLSGECLLAIEYFRRIKALSK